MKGSGKSRFKPVFSDDVGKRLVNLLSEDHSQANETGKHTLVLEPYGYCWYRVGGLDYLLKRSDPTRLARPVIRPERAMRRWARIHRRANLFASSVEER